MNLFDRVRLKPFEEEPEQFGQVLHIDRRNDTCLVQLDRAELSLDDDGLREVPMNQMEVV